MPGHWGINSRKVGVIAPEFWRFRFDDSAVDLEILTINQALQTCNKVNDILLSLNLDSVYLFISTQNYKSSISRKELLYDNGKREPCTRE
jgi:hypothetical protein